MKSPASTATHVPYSWSRFRSKEYNLHLSCVKKMLVERLLASYFKVDDKRVRELHTKIPRLNSGVGKTGVNIRNGLGKYVEITGGKLSYPTYFMGQVGEAAHGSLVRKALEGGGVNLEYYRVIDGVPTRHAVVMLQPDGQNSIIIVGGANTSCWPEVLPDEDLEFVKSAGIVLLQRGIPDSINIQAARSAGVPVILDAGGVDSPLPPELLSSVDMFSPNETELGRLTGLPAKSLEQISQAVWKLHEKGVKQVLVKLDAKGSTLFVQGQEPIKQPIVSAQKVIDTTGAGDTFTTAFAGPLSRENLKQNA